MCLIRGTRMLTRLYSLAIIAIVAVIAVVLALAIVAIVTIGHITMYIELCVVWTYRLALRIVRNAASHV